MDASFPKVTSATPAVTRSTPTPGIDKSATSAAPNVRPKDSEEVTGRFTKTQDQRTQAFDSVPLQLLRNPEWTRSEWGWRRLLYEVVAANQASNGKVEDTATPRADGGAVESLWQLMTQFAANQGTQARGTAVMYSPSQALAVFSNLHEEQFWQQPKQTRDAVVADRLLSSVHVQGEPLSGSGAFFPQLLQVLAQGIANAPPPPTRPAPLGQRDGSVEEGVKWDARRWTSVTANGSVVHRLKLSFSVEQSAVELELTASNPYLQIHLATDDQALCRVLEETKSSMLERLERESWQIERCMIGALQKPVSQENGFSDEQSRSDFG